jgi:hypothetical protein
MSSRRIALPVPIMQEGRARFRVAEVGEPHQACAAKLSRATILRPGGIDLSSGKVRHDIGDEKLAGLFVVSIAIDKQLDTGCLVLSDQVDDLGHRTDKAV